MEAEENKTNIYKALNDVKNLMQDNSENETVNQDQDIVLPEDNVLELAGHEIHEFESSQELAIDDVEDYELSPSTTNNSEQLMPEKIADVSTKAIHASLNESDPTSRNILHNNGVLVEDLVKELVRPYINSWLEQNLSSIVKEVVDKEVKKLMRRDKD